MKTIPLTRGYTALIDDDDYTKVAAFSWYAAEYGRERGRSIYAQREIKNSDGSTTCLKLHQMLFPPQPGMIVDHRDGNGLDCRKENLRYATRLNNGSNKRKTIRPSTSKYKGVCWRKDANCWRASIRVRGVLKSLGNFLNETEAAQAYDRAAMENFGEFAALNFAAKGQVSALGSIDAPHPENLPTWESPAGGC